MSYKRDSQEAKRRAGLYLMVTAALIIAGAAFRGLWRACSTGRSACPLGSLKQLAHASVALFFTFPVVASCCLALIFTMA